MSAYGLEAHARYKLRDWGDDGLDGVFNLRIPNEQFGRKLPPLRVVCTDISFIQGMTFFQDIRAQQLKNQNLRGGVVFIPTPITQKISALSEAHDIPVISRDNFKEFAGALKVLKLNANNKCFEIPEILRKLV